LGFFTEQIYYKGVKMAVVIFDVETVGVDFEGLDPLSKEALLKNAETEEEEQTIKDGLGLSPLTGEIVAIAMLDCGSDEGVVYYQDSDNAGESLREDNVDYIVCSEKEILENFWKRIKLYQQFVTYNGRGFDCPYIMIRSGIFKIKPTRDLMPYRYDTKSHIDLYDQLTFYGAMRRGFSLHMVTHAFGIKSPKEEGVSGGFVADLFEQKRNFDIACYCMRDVRATKDVYLRWEKYIRP